MKRMLATLRKAKLPISDGSGPTPILTYTNQKRTGLIAFKKGMTTIWDEFGKVTPVTVLKISECFVVNSRFHSGSGQWMVQVGSRFQRRVQNVKRPQKFHFLKYGLKPLQYETEFPVSEDATLPNGLELKATHFVPGQYIDVQSLSTGKGFQGVMKRWGFKGGRASHGNSLAHRTMGSTGQCQDPGKVWPGKKMPGRMGGKTITVQNLKVLKIDTVHQLLYVKGAVPGVDNALIKVRDAVKKGWFGKTFPENATVPFPTFMGGDLERELLPKMDLSGIDPFARTRHEKT